MMINKQSCNQLKIVWLQQPHETIDKQSATIQNNQQTIATIQGFSNNCMVATTTQR